MISSGVSRATLTNRSSTASQRITAQPPAPGRNDDPALVAKGKELFDKGLPERGIPACHVCHGPDALGKADFPRLAGQHAKYIVKQLNYIQSLVRTARSCTASSRTSRQRKSLQLPPTCSRNSALPPKR